VRAARPAVGADDGLVGEDRFELAVVVGDLVGARQGRAGHDGDDDPVGDVRPGIVEELRPHPEDATVVVDGDGRVVDLQPLVVGGDEVLAPVLDPLHGPVQLHRRPGDEDLLRVAHHDLGAEATADVGGDHPDVLLGQPQQLAEIVADPDRRLGAVPHRQLAHLRIPLGHDATALHGRRCAPVEDEPLPEDVRGPGEGLFHVTHPLGIVGADVGADVLVDQRRIRPRRLLQIDHRRQGGVLRLDQLHGVLRQVPVLRDDERHRFARVADLLRGQGVLRLVVDQCRVRDEWRQRRGQGGREIGPGVDGDDPGGRLRSGDVDAEQARVGVGAAQEGGVGHPGQPDVVDIQPAAGQQPRIFAASDAFAEVAGPHGKQGFILYGPRRLACWPQAMAGGRDGAVPAAGAVQTPARRCPSPSDRRYPWRMATSWMLVISSIA